MLLLSSGSVTIALTTAEAKPSGFSFYIRAEASKTPLNAAKENLFRPIASLTKLMLALVVVDHLKPKETWKAPVTFKRPPGSAAGLIPGQTYRTLELLAGLVAASGNDTALALADQLGIKGVNAVAAMNKKAKTMGLRQTVYGDVIGFGCPSCGSTAREQWFVLKAVAVHPRLGQLLRTRGEMRLPLFGARRGHQLRGRLAGLTMPENFLGGKTGQTIAAGNCLAGIWRSRKGEILAIALGGGDLAATLVKLDLFIQQKNL